MISYKRDNFIVMNEYYNKGNNINEIEEQYISINTTNKLLQKAENSSNNKELKLLISKIKKSRVKSYVENIPLEVLINNDILSWGYNSSKDNGECIEMLNSFIEDLKNNEQFIKLFKFHDEEQIKLWIIVKDSISEEADEIYSDFLNKYSEDDCSIMIYDQEVSDHVKSQVEYITDNYEVISKDESTTS